MVVVGEIVVVEVVVELVVVVVVEVVLCGSLSSSMHVGSPLKQLLQNSSENELQSENMRQMKLSASKV